MASLKELRTRIGSIKSTQKITSAMKMVAAARLRRAQDVLARSQTYSENLLTTAGRLLHDMQQEQAAGQADYFFPRMILPVKEAQVYWLVVFSSDRGLCGSYNAYVLREAVRRIRELQKNGKTVKVIAIGKKAGDTLRRRFDGLDIEIMSGVAAKGADYQELQAIAERLIVDYPAGRFDVCEVIYTRFNSAVNREVKTEQFIPLEIDTANPRFGLKAGEAFYDYDAPKDKILIDILPMLMTSVLFQNLLNSQASEHGARMTSMDNATRNAKDMISKLTLKYNRLRQNAITTELIEIISGAEAL
ncbi:MAG: ATP synthase F1 subunit gamma [Proteobacteria bacterium]|nr:ATP synthase F1 subunit gamma [Pseudomonadota bacterium]